jgi:diguanylate cyclase (GGDEF)-like protein
MATELSRARVHNYPLTIALVAMDGYRQCVEAHGVDGAHALLADTASIIQANLHDVDLLARFSADKFILCLSGSAHTEAASRLQAIRDAVSGKITGPDGQPAISAIGAISMEAGATSPYTLRDLLAELGNALMQARCPEHSGLCVTNMPHERDPNG